MPIEQHLIIFAAAVLGGSYGIAFGGGSFLILPVLFLLGVDPKIAVATNVAAAIVQLATGAFKFHRNKKVHYEIVPETTIFYLLGGILGAFILIEIDPEFIKKIVSGAIIVFAIFSLLKRKRMLDGSCHRAKRKSILAYPLLLVLGGYQILVTAGSGTLLTFILIYLFGLNLKCSIYTRQIITLPNMVIATGILIYSGLIDWTLLIPLTAGRAVGALIGSELVMRTKADKLSIIFAAVVITIALKTLLS